ncbi:MAG TPA: oxygen-independent coproporphyrinogen III oxidase [Gammaproteobacteria bacterium]|nr:oxygen-independent coproporphyrinogen III oxidase [Gammaproteobacteria bacterium]
MQVEFNLDLIHRYDKAGPRYTSYPTAVQFHPGFADEEYSEFARLSNRLNPGGALSLYFHIPFCDTVCFYCGCNKVVTKDRSKADVYLDHVYKELALQSELFDRDRQVDQLHWGGGTPTFISHEQMTELMQTTRKHFNLHDDDTGEYSIEIDPREASPETITLLRELGFNRLSLGVQDFDPDVQKAVNRIQSEEETMTVIDAARNEDFKSISLDLIYGLPRQSVESFSKTLDKIIKVNPDRLSVFNYAHLPEMFKPQRRINVEELPTPAEKLDILQYIIQRLSEAGYVYIGMDHFARPDDELALAQQAGSLYRNFQGYSTHADCDLIALGATGIGQVANSYSQNVKGLDEYYSLVDEGHLPVFRGIELNADDILRRHVINRLMCDFALDWKQVVKTYGIQPGQYFASEWQDLKLMEDDGLLVHGHNQLQVKPAGRLLIRNICMVFDKYLRSSKKQRYSKVI